MLVLLMDPVIFFMVLAQVVYMQLVLTIISIQEHFLRKVLLILSMVQIPVLYMACIMKYIIQELELNRVYKILFIRNQEVRNMV